MDNQKNIQNLIDLYEIEGQVQEHKEEVNLEEDAQEEQLIKINDESIEEIEKLSDKPELNEEQQQIIQCNKCNSIPDNYIALNCNHNYCLLCLSNIYYSIKYQLMENNQEYSGNDITAILLSGEFALKLTCEVCNQQTELDLASIEALEKTISLIQSQQILSQIQDQDKKNCDVIYEDSHEDTNISELTNKYQKQQNNNSLFASQQISVVSKQDLTPTNKQIIEQQQQSQKQVITLQKIFQSRQSNSNNNSNLSSNQHISQLISNNSSTKQNQFKQQKNSLKQSSQNNSSNNTGISQQSNDLLRNKSNDNQCLNSNIQYQQQLQQQPINYLSQQSTVKSTIVSSDMISQQQSQQQKSTLQKAPNNELSKSLLMLSNQQQQTLNVKQERVLENSNRVEFQTPQSKQEQQQFNQIQVIKCLEHNNVKVNFICFHCQRADLCIYCLTSGLHCNHKIKEFNEALEDIYDLLKELKNKFELQQNIISKENNEKIELMTNVKTKVKKIRSNLFEIIEKIKNDLDKKKQQFDQQINEIMTQNLGQIDKHCQQFKQQNIDQIIKEIDNKIIQFSQAQKNDANSILQNFEFLLINERELQKNVITIQNQNQNIQNIQAKLVLTENQISSISDKIISYFQALQQMLNEQLIPDKFFEQSFENYQQQNNYQHISQLSKTIYSPLQITLQQQQDYNEHQKIVTQIPPQAKIVENIEQWKKQIQNNQELNKLCNSIEKNSQQLKQVKNKTQIPIATETSPLKYISQRNQFYNKYYNRNAFSQTTRSPFLTSKSRIQENTSPLKQYLQETKHQIQKSMGDKLKIIDIQTRQKEQNFINTSLTSKSKVDQYLQFQKQVFQNQRFKFNI